MKAERTAEHRKYHAAYELPHYAMGLGRMRDALDDLRALPECKGSYLDVGCGRGEMLEKARQLGFGPKIKGVEVVPQLIGGDVVKGQAHKLPFKDNSFDVVTMFDVIEHLLPGDDELACKEMLRVAKKHILITANNRPSHLPDGRDLHINIRPYEEWHDLFCKWFAPATVTWIKGPRAYVSEGWRIDIKNDTKQAC